MEEQSKRKLQILLTNDDGVEAKGLEAIYREFKDLAKVIVVAPKNERSAFGHSITLADPLRIEEVYQNGQVYGYAVSGTPVDCVKLAISVILESPPDLVISGINWGLNTGVHIAYSGTVSAALEATILGLPAIAFSLAPHDPTHFTLAAQFAKKLVLTVLEQGLPHGTLLNVNLPPFPGSGVTPPVVITRQAKCHVRDNFQKRIDPRNKTYYWLEAEEMAVAEESDGFEIDVRAVREGKISITPIHFDLTNHKVIQLLKEWQI